MGRVLLAVLLASGISTLFIVENPQWVLYGLFMLILPGLILMFTPEFFMVLLCFSTFWSWLRFRLRPAAAIGLAILLSALFFYSVGSVDHARGAAAFAAATQASDIRPTQRLALAGDIRLSMPSLDLEWYDADVVAKYRRQVELYDQAEAADQVRRQAAYDAAQKAQEAHCAGPCPSIQMVFRGRSQPSYPVDVVRGWKCNALCAALFATPGVTSVTVDEQGASPNLQPLSLHALTFRMLPKDRCPANTVMPANPGALDIDPSDRPSGAAPVQSLDYEWQVRLAYHNCILTVPTLARHDITIADSRFSTPSRPANTKDKPKFWGFDAWPVSTSRLEVSNRSGNIILRESFVTTRAIAIPLQIGIEKAGSDGFGWQRMMLTNRPRYFQYRSAALLAKATSLYTGGDPSIELQQLQGNPE